MIMTTNQLLGVCLFLLQLEERMDHEGRTNIARWARRRYEWYKSRLEGAKQNAGCEADRQRTHRPARA
ncbi:hypothetical protein COLU111180_12085 [Cohnella lubricantis]|uniref:Uncharacterized protein n=1 Tax=Cohnella lubricantis TaxID=2163172 RepID=A0A841T9M8_9BACL|nr:hypothetical protein [Cohnella lubricantis]MBB6675960.1 hypothetical protein [Cohnella lubricantis]MBP2117922.1 hypothetical protein [Cohnella lubricantis]